jgi:hypothetical protein
MPTVGDVTRCRMSERATSLRVSGHVRHGVEFLQGELPVRGDVAQAAERVFTGTVAVWPVHLIVFRSLSGRPTKTPSPFPYKQALRAYGVVLR